VTHVDIDAEFAQMKRRRMEREGLSLVPEPEPPKQLEWPVIDEVAYYGLAGDIVRTLEPHTEADRVALLLQILTFAPTVTALTCSLCWSETVRKVGKGLR